MERKKDIQILLDQLKQMGKSRADIERELNYSPKYITQQVAKGGNERLYASLIQYRNGLAHGGVAKSNTLRTPDPANDDFRSKYIAQLEKENGYLQEIVKTNLTVVLATVRTLSVRQRAVGEVVLHSLERIEQKSKKATGALVAAADRQMDQIEREAYARDNDPALNR